VLSGCGAAPPAPSKAELQTASLSQRAARANEQGDLRRAQALYAEALRVDTSVENADGIAMNQVNLAAVHQSSGDAEAAHRMLDLALADAPLPAPAARRAEAAARKAQLYFGASDPARAAQWAQKAHEYCAERCAALPAILNLRGRIALAQRDPGAAIGWGTRALAAASTDELRTERANAHRLIGEARMARGEHQAAAPSLSQALALDQALGLGAKIELDLVLLARAQEALGNRAAAQDYISRAQAVSAALKEASPQPRRPGP
jgi:tetratricopeptide (TPR) repeat protein